VWVEGLAGGLAAVVDEACLVGPAEGVLAVSEGDRGQARVDDADDVDGVVMRCGQWLMSLPGFYTGRRKPAREFLAALP
jgi:hypothetical protein